MLHGMVHVMSATGATMASNGPSGQAASGAAANDNRTAEPDFDLHDHGSVVVLVPHLYLSSLLISEATLD